jgi:hypothetical protein
MAYSHKSSRKHSRKHSSKSSRKVAKHSRKMSRKHSAKSSHKKSPKRSCPRGQKRIRGFTRVGGVKVKGHCSRPKGRKVSRKTSSRKMGFEYDGGMGFQDGEY